MPSMNANAIPMSDISLLPEDMRGKEQTEETKPRPTPDTEPGLRMHVPSVEADEDIEIIEVDEGDLAAVLSEEPFMTKLTYRMSLIFDRVRGQFGKSQESAPPPKVPPQFFKPPRPGLVTTPSPAGAPGVSGGAKPSMAPSATAAGATSAVRKPGDAHQGSGHSMVRIMPQTSIPRRVRVIRRIRKPVRVSLIPPEELIVFSVNVGKRKWTIGIFVFFFTVLVGGGYFFISQQTAIAMTRLVEARAQNAGVQAEIGNQLEQWGTYEDLEARMQLLGSQLDRHIVVTRLFSFLEETTLPNVTYQNAVWSAQAQQLSLDVAAASYDATAQQVMVFEKHPLVASVDASGFTAEKDAETHELSSVRFSLTIELKPGTFIGPGVIQTPEDASVSSTANVIP